jgi:hypothetical protein
MALTAATPVRVQTRGMASTSIPPQAHILSLIREMPLKLADNAISGVASVV